MSEVILPALAEDRVVVSDRFLDSSLAYQGGARGLGIEDVAQVNRFATRSLRPDLTFLLEIDTTTAAAGPASSDRFEEEGDALQEAVIAAYERLIELDPGRWRRIDATRLPDEVHADVLAEVEAAAQRGDGMSAAALAGTEDHPQARIVCRRAGRHSLARVSVPRARGHRQAHGGTCVRGRAARPRARTSRTPCACGSSTAPTPT